MQTIMIDNKSQLPLMEVLGYIANEKDIPADEVLKICRKISYCYKRIWFIKFRSN